MKRTAMLRRAGQAGLAAGALAACGTYTYLSKGSGSWSDWWSSLRAVRFGRATYAAFRVSLDYKLTLRSLEYGTPAYWDTISKVHRRSALCLQDMCSKNGGLFIKVGQHIGSLEYLLPVEYVRAFKVFHSEAPETTLPRLKEVIREELGRPAEEVFSELSDSPLGAASLAQCHRGVLDDGTVVAVKIQHPDVKRNAYTDMDTMDFLVRCVSWVFPDFHFQWLAEETRKNLPHELDFTHEAANQERALEMFKHLKFVKIPGVIWELTTPRLLTMEFCEGGKIDNLKYIRHNGLPVNEISHKLSRMYSEMIFLCGYIHCDPHPGNVLVRPDKRGRAEIVLLDHGLYTQLTDDFRLTYCRLWQALLSQDHEAIKQRCLDLQAGAFYPLLACMVTARAWSSIQDGITNSSPTQSELHIIQASIPQYLSEITQLLNTVPRQLVLILKTNDLLRGIDHALGSSRKEQSYLTMSKCCLRAIGDYELQTSSSWYASLVCHTRTHVSLMVLQLYEIWLWWKAVLSL